MNEWIHRADFFYMGNILLIFAFFFFTLCVYVFLCVYNVTDWLFRPQSHMHVYVFLAGSDRVGCGLLPQFAPGIGGSFPASIRPIFIHLESAKIRKSFFIQNVVE